MHTPAHDANPRAAAAVPISLPTAQDAGFEGLSMPSLGRFLRQIREAIPNSRTGRPISRETAARRVGLSAAYLTQIEKDLRVPTPQALQLLTSGYALTAAQTRHIHDLREQPIPVLSTETMRARVQQSPAILDRLTSLDRAGLIAAYFDPFWNLLAANSGMHRAFPGLERVGNLAVWHFTEEARHRLLDWEYEAALMASVLKAVLGVHRRSDGGRRVLARLHPDADFRRLWTRTSLITYRRDPAIPLRIRSAQDQVRYFDVETSTVTDVHSYTRLYQGLTVTLTTI